MVVLVALALGTGLRIAYVHRPFDHRVRSPWRQADYIQIARNFDREGMNIFYPRIDWRGDGPGFVESEFPLIPWLAAWGFRVFGIHVQILRLVSSVLALASLFLFAWFATKLFPPLAASTATLLFAFNPLLFHLATSFQPEALLIPLSVLAGFLILRWSLELDQQTLILAAVALGAAMLAKSTAIALGLFLAIVILQRLGWRAFSRPVVYTAGALALAPSLLWYLWSHHFWLDYGNSLGLSNGDHFLTLEMLAPPSFVLGILKWETFGVFTPVGWILAIVALARGTQTTKAAAQWYAATFIFYLIAAKTSSADWAFYYHALGVAPACLLMGSGFTVLFSEQASEGGSNGIKVQRWSLSLLGVALIYSALAIGGIVFLRDSRTDLEGMKVCSEQFAQLVRPQELIAVSGDNVTRDEVGRPNAFNISMVFTWMDRKGFNYGRNELSIETLDEITSRGGRFWVAEDRELAILSDQGPESADFKVVDRCDLGYSLLDLTSRAGRN